MLNKSVDARFCLLRAQVLKSLGKAEEAEKEMLMAYEHAHTIGFNAYFSNAEMPSMFTQSQEKLLAQGWAEGKDDAERQEYLRAEVEGSIGSHEEWDALSSDEQDAHWDEFHDRCALGVADEMYFYRVMMNKHMVGYVGH